MEHRAPHRGQGQWRALKALAGVQPLVLTYIKCISVHNSCRSLQHGLGMDQGTRQQQQADHQHPWLDPCQCVSNDEHTETNVCQQEYGLQRPGSGLELEELWDQLSMSG